MPQGAYKGKPKYRECSAAMWGAWEATGWAKAELARRLGEKPQVVHGWLTGQYWPPPGPKRTRLRTTLGLALAAVTPNDEELPTDNERDVNPSRDKVSQNLRAGETPQEGSMVNLAVHVGKLEQQIADLRRVIDELSFRVEELGARPRKARK